MFPYPVYALCRLIAEISCIEIATKKKNKNYLVAIGCLELGNLDGLLFTALVHIREVSRRFRFDQHGEVWQFGFLGLNYDVMGILTVFESALATTLPDFTRTLSRKQNVPGCICVSGEAGGCTFRI